jgi:hypothetical protein
MRVVIASHPCFSVAIVVILVNECMIVPHCDLNLHFPGDQRQKQFLMHRLVMCMSFFVEISIGVL